MAWACILQWLGQGPGGSRSSMITGCGGCGAGLAVDESCWWVDRDASVDDRDAFEVMSGDHGMVSAEAGAAVVADGDCWFVGGVVEAVHETVVAASAG